MKTRFATVFRCFVSLLRCKAALKSVISTHNWPGNDPNAKASAAAKAASIAEHVDDSQFWSTVDNIVAVWEPVAEVCMQSRWFTAVLLASL